MTTTKVNSEFIAVNAISGTIIADGAITSTHLAVNSVDSSELVTGSIDTIHIAANQVTATKIVTNGVLTRHISNDQVTADKLANSINTDIATGPAALPKAGGTMTGNLTVNAIVDADNFKINGGQGSDGQVLTSTGSGVAWEAAGVAGIVSSADATAITIDSSERVGIGRVPNANGVLQISVGTNENCNLIFSENTDEKWLIGNVYTNDDLRFINMATSSEKFRIASSGQIGIGGENYGTDGQVLTSTGASSAPAWEDAGGGVTSLNGLSDATVTSSDPALNTNPSSGVGTLWINSSSGTSYICTDATSNSNVWTNITDGQNIQPTIDVDFLVIAGGGAGGRGNNAAGGAGAGGYRNSFGSETSGGGGSSETALGFKTGIVYTITVGAGGAQNTASSNHVGLNGSISTITGSNIIDITTVGGGGGASSTVVSNSGGSGGGGAYTAKAGGAGTANQGYKGGDAYAAANVWSGAGGGGAGAAGANVSVHSNDGTTAGGAGLTSSITGSATTRAGGGGGCSDAGANGGGAAGGSGGGGTGGSGSFATNGTANTGSGGGASGAGTPGSGGSGVVILRLLTSEYSGTTSGNPTVTTSGSYTILNYTSSGSYTG